MSDNFQQPQETLPIAAVERDTGLPKDTLRVWERRYGYPMPGRDAGGERAYTPAQVEKLRVIKRLLDAGHRPGRVVPLSLELLQQLADETGGQPKHAAVVLCDSADMRSHLALIRGHDVAALRAELMRLMARYGLARFVSEVVAPLNVVVGDAWMRGQLEIFEEHTYTEVVQTVLRQTVASLSNLVGRDRPRVLLTTLPGEPHQLGLLMAEAVFALEGCDCVSLGAQTPVLDIARAAQAYRGDIVALSFTGCMNPNQVIDGLAELVTKLPSGTQVWVGGSAPVLSRRSVVGVLRLTSFESLAAEVRRWRDGARLPSRATADSAVGAEVAYLE